MFLTTRTERKTFGASKIANLVVFIQDIYQIGTALDGIQCGDAHVVFIWFVHMMARKCMISVGTVTPNVRFD